MERTTTKEQTLESVLTRPDVEQALVSLVERLPEIEKSLRRLEDAVDFGMATMNDQQVRQKVDTLLDSSNLQVETLEAAVKLAEKLPMLLQVTNQLEQVLAFAQDVYGDEQTRELIGQRVDEYVAPVKEKADATRTMLTEIRARAERDDRNITLFSLVRWLKEPSVQHGLKYMQATVEVLSEQTKK
ncbi:hypothetical protein EVJ27_08480 [Exiguobacterium sp. SH3S2]|uniref:hypothetical protein n=1 Tax=unclassified Exiguobacterium TaxID=2644629 RepID=UPI00103DD998|nr:MULTISPECIES: hypothetical protein [unclassified Exiguobacterium]TCI24603.1 hypothetical protein EVJ32_13465 [Exiguobacterium sp. SH5S4]TCI44861.1 hypothetical protein EVJ28_08480 [Exiguobacterium sp. SH3S3]TCI53933.1 hypothetical protein EVJ30_06615 [Exiguobacterium sp. SH5S13]TCI60282.1 hypothetical protein EVJ27_08480 [Exiguobacterium sp. SH3S2]TCI64255.1 hypothetical protein EVJ26_05220 [Exiguobacterium sp. SH3S1]